MNVKEKNTLDIHGKETTFALADLKPLWHFWPQGYWMSHVPCVSSSSKCSHIVQHLSKIFVSIRKIRREGGIHMAV